MTIFVSAEASENVEILWKRAIPWLDSKFHIPQKTVVPSDCL